MAKSVFKSTQTPDLVIVDLTNNFVKIARARKVGEETHFLKVKKQKFGDNSDPEISDYIAETFKEWGIKQKNAICIVPSKLFISKNVDMPSNDPEEIEKIIDLQSGRYTPYSRDEIIIDYLCMSTAGQHYTNVLLLIVNRKLIDRYIEIFDQAGVFLSRIAVSSESMAEYYKKIMPTIEIGGAIAGIHIDKDSCDLSIIDKNELVFVRSIPVGASHFLEDEAHARKAFTSELNKSITSYQDHGVGQMVKALVLTGLNGGIRELDRSIREEVPMMEDPNFPIRMVSYANDFKIAENAGLVDEEGGPPDSFFEVISTGAAEAALKIDFVPKEIKLKRKFREGGREIITLGILVMTCILMFCLFLASKIYIKNNLIDQLEDTGQKIAVQARVLERASTKSRVLRNLIEYRGKGLYVFDKVTSLISEDIYLSEFNYDHEGNLHLVGTAETMSGVFAFVSKLEDSGYFSSVVTNETKTRKEGSREVADFDIECTLIEEI